MNARTPGAVFLGRLRLPVAAEDLVPPPRFRAKTFADYRIDDTIPGQAEAVTAVRTFAEGIPARRGWLRRMFAQARSGLYLDGDFGVGKTHLLAATWNACRGRARYLSFAEAMSLCVVHGAEAAAAILDAELVCIDEFELDDPSNTRLADLLLARLVERGTRLMVTSNTVPGELGVGRMFVEQFKAQMVRIGEHFASIHVPGHDYRRRAAITAATPCWGRPAPFAADRGAVVVDQVELDRLLQELPIINLRRFAGEIPALEVRGLDTFADQLPALRFVHLVDRLYEYRTPVRFHADCAIDDLFHPAYRDWSFAKKYRRCCSRLSEMCGEDMP